MDTDLKSPTATGANGNDWTTPANAYSSNNQYASRVDNAGTYIYQSYETFAFGIPAGATINGIEVQLEGYNSTADSKGSQVEVYSASQVNWYGKGRSIPSTEGTVTAGGAADLWAGSWLDT